MVSPQCDAGDVKVVQEVVDLRRTCGKKGVPPLEAIPEDVCSGIGCGKAPLGGGDPMCAECRQYWGAETRALPEEHEQPNDKQPYSASTTCKVCGDFIPCDCGTVRVCKGIPIAQGPDEACTCVLGPGLERCVVCADWMQRCGECDGCNGHLPGWQVTGQLCGDCRELRLVTKRRPEDLAARIRAILGDGAKQVLCDGCHGHIPGWEVTGELCGDCRRLRLATRQRPENLAERIRVILGDATEQAWQALAESPSLDPVTVGVCKRLRDMERGL